MKSANLYNEDIEIKTTLNKITENITPSDSTLESIKYNLSQKGDFNMKNKVLLPKKIVLITAILVVSISTICLGGSHFFSSVTSHSSKNDEITHYPTAEEVLENVDYLPKYPNSLPGGFAFKSAQPTAMDFMDENNNKALSQNTIDFYYTKPDLLNSQYLSLSTMPSVANQEQQADYTATTEYKGIALNYSADTYKFAPPDYELTAEDNENIAKGHYFVSYGSQEVEIRQMQFVSWTEGNIDYSILASDLNLTAEDMYAMAQAVINE